MIEGGTVDSGDMPGLLADAMEKADWQGFEAWRSTARANGNIWVLVWRCIWNNVAAAVVRVSC